MRMPRFGKVLLLAALALALSLPPVIPGPVGSLAVAQEPEIVVAVGSNATASVVPKGTIELPVSVNMSSADNLKLKSFKFTLNWDPSRLSLQGFDAGEVGTVSVDESGVSGGKLRGSFSRASGAESSFTLLALSFSATDASGGTVISAEVTEAANEAGNSIRSYLVPRDLSLCVGAVGISGDVTGEDDEINIVDAQQIARYSVGLSVSERRRIFTQGDVNNDHVTNIVDAQQVARFSVGLPTPNTIIGEPAPGCSNFHPIVEILSPLNGASYAFGEEIVFQGFAYDPEGGEFAPGDMHWRSQSAVLVRQGNNFSFANLPDGPNEITLTVIDGDGVLVRDTVSIVIPEVNDNPNAEIISPPPEVEQEFVEGEQILFRGSATDEEDGVIPDSSLSWHSDFDGFLGRGSSITVEGLTAGVTHTITLTAVDSEGAGDEASTGIVVLLRAIAGPWAQVTTGGRHACALTESGEAYCWGSNEFGQLGGAQLERSNAPVAVKTDILFRDISAGNAHTCGVALDQQAFCWGMDREIQGGHGALGDGPDSKVFSTTPVEVAGNLAFSSIHGGGGYSCGVTEGGRAYCWGSNFNGNLGNGEQLDSGEDSPVPVATEESFLAGSMSVGGAHTCGITTDGAAYCWGFNQFGQVGSGETGGRVGGEAIPVKVASDLEFREISAAVGHTCAVTATGTGKCWGNNTYGQLGTGEPEFTPNAPQVSEPFPQDVLLSSVRSISAGHGGGLSGNLNIGYTCAVDGQGSAWCWGWGTNGELGVGKGTAANEPQRVNLKKIDGSLRFTGINASVIDPDEEGDGDGFVCALSTGGSIYCWGDNSWGQLGNGMFGGKDGQDMIPRPVRVRNP